VRVEVAQPVVAIYLNHYLTVSMTFVHRQILGAVGAVRPIVLAESVANRELFPFEPVFACERDAIGGRLAGILRRVAGRNRLLTPRQLLYFGRVLRDQHVALIHAHFGPHGLDMLPLARALRIPLLVTFHGYDASSMLRDASYRRSLRSLFRHAHIITVSELMRERLLGFGAVPERTRVHYIGVPVEEFAFVARKPVAEKHSAGEPIRFLQISNFVEKKGHRYTLEAYARLAARHRHCHLTLAGDGPLRAEMERLATQLGIRERVAFPGKVSKDTAIPLMNEADVFLHHSVTGTDGDQEGIPTVLMEAMATGLAVISTKHAGIPEIVEHGRTGVLVPERDVDGYLVAIEDVLTRGDPELGRRASAFVHQRLDIRRQNAELVEIYRSILRR
jgi:colanic acid/amylovoran biosynthesis glycosyltransferase